MRSMALDVTGLPVAFVLPINDHGHSSPSVVENAIGAQLDPEPQQVSVAQLSGNPDIVFGH